MIKILNIAGYKFVTLQDLPQLQSEWLGKVQSLSLKGTILISQEGVNITLAGLPEKIATFVTDLKSDSRFSDISFRESYSAFQPFNKIKVKIKKEIITLRQPDIFPGLCPAPMISPTKLKQWLDEERDIVILDTRNDYEFRFGTFRNAVNLYLHDFSGFPAALDAVARHKPVVMFCTGGIRCEKAALVMLKAGFSEVYQLQGGILNYFAEVGSEHFDGECFVFDQRVAINGNLEATGTTQCRICQGPVPALTQPQPAFIPIVSCPSCVNHLT